MKAADPRIAHFIERQFPEVYRTEGPQLVEFVKSYYEWLGESNNVLSEARNLQRNRDIDDTREALLDNFVIEYMHGLPVEILGDRRFLQKHILDLYRSKGSNAGLKLLFQLIYREDIDIYIPSRDMLAPSDGTWHQPKYLEINYTRFNQDYLLKQITGVNSEATAIVEDYVIRNVRGRPVYLFYLSNIVGEFEVGEPISYEGFEDPTKIPRILGSVTEMVVTGGGLDNRIGDAYRAGDDQGTGIGLEVRVSELRARGTGLIEFSIQWGGTGYTMDSLVYIINKAILTEDGADYIFCEDGVPLDAAFVGSGATFEVGSIVNTEILSFSDTIVLPYENDTLEDFTFLYNPMVLQEDTGAIYTEDGTQVFVTETLASNTTMNDNALVSDWEEASNTTVGTIGSLVNINPGSEYTEDVTVWVVEPSILSFELAANNGYMGNNAVIEGEAVAGSNVATAMRVVDSGFGYANGQALTLNYSGNDFLRRENVDETLTTEDGEALVWGDVAQETELEAEAVIGAVGFGRGEWTSTKGFLNADKYIQDSFYYQEYSYDVQSSRSLDRYEETLRKVYHPAGVELFGTAVVRDEVDLESTVTPNTSSANVGAGTSSLTLLGSETGMAIDFSNTEPNITIWHGSNGALSFAGDPFDKLTHTRASTGTYYNANGILTTAAVDEPRYDYNPTNLTPRGLLIEPQRTNQMLHSSDYTQSAWTVERATVSKSVTGPDGVANSACRVTETATTGTHGFIGNTANRPAVGTSDTQVLSVYLKYGTRRYVSVMLADGSGTGAGIIVDLQSGTITDDNAASWTYLASSIEACPDGWYRVVLAADTGAATTAVPHVRFASANAWGGAFGTEDAILSYAGDAAAYVDVFGMQFEEDVSWATSYIPTTTASVTRQQDQTAILTTLFPYSATAGTISAEFTPHLRSGNPVDYVWDLYFSEPERIGLFWNDTPEARLIVDDNNSSVVSFTKGINALGTTSKVAFAWALNDAAAVCNGGSPSTDTSVSLPDAATVLNIGHQNGSNVGNGWIRKLKYLPRRATNTELQTFTS